MAEYQSGMNVKLNILHNNGVIYIVLNGGESLILRMGGLPAVLSAGWSPVFVYAGFRSFLFLELRHENGAEATWILNQDGERIAGTIAELDVAQREALCSQARPILNSLSSILLSADNRKYAESYLVYLALNQVIRSELESLCGGAMLVPTPKLIDYNAVEDVVVNHAGLILPTIVMHKCLAHNLQEQYLSACVTGQMQWPSPVDGVMVNEIHGLVLSPLVMAWRCVDRRHGLVFFIIAAGFDQETTALYLPESNLVLFRPKTKFTQIDIDPAALIDWLKKHILTHSTSLLGFLAAPPRRIAQFTWPHDSAHIGHYLWNELSGLESISDRLRPEKYPLIYDLGGAAGAAFYGPISLLFPEFKGLTIDRFTTIPDMLSNAYSEGVQVLRFSGAFVLAETRKRIANLVVGTSTVEVARQALWNTTGPVVVLGLRVENRTLTNLAEFYVQLCKSLARRFGAVTIIIDGHNRRNVSDQSGVFSSFLEHRATRPVFEVEKEIAAAIKVGLTGQPVTVIDCVGMPMLENIAWLSLAHYCVAPWGAGLAKYRWVCNLPTYVLISQFCLKNKNDLYIYNDPIFMEDPSPVMFSKPDFVVDRPDVPVLLQMDPIHVPYYINYEAKIEPISDEIGDSISRLNKDAQDWPRHRPHSDFRIENDVVMGKNGELFLANGGHHVLDQVLGYRKPLRISVANFASNIENRAATAAAVDAQYVHVIFPDKQSVLPADFGLENLLCLGQYYAEKCKDVWPHVVYPLDALREEPKGLFLRTDTHMTHLGTLTVVRMVLERLFGKACEQLIGTLHARIGEERPYLGDLGRKLENKPEDRQSFIAVDPKSKRYSNNYNNGNNGAVSVYRLPNAPMRERLVVFGDSFANDMSWVLAQMFSEVVFFRTPYLHPELLEMVKPDIVISENVERYLAHVAPDSERPSFAMMHAMTYGETAEQREFAEALSAVCAFGRPPYQRLIDRLEFNSV